MNKTLLICEESQAGSGVTAVGYCRFDGDGLGEYTSRATSDHRIIYLEKGYLKFIKNGKAILSATAPCLIYSSPDSRDFTACSNDCRDFWVSFAGLDDIISELPVPENGILTAGCTGSAEILRSRFEGIINELRIKEGGYAVASQATLLKIILFFFRSQSDASPARDSIKRKLSPALVIMNEEIGENHSMDYYAKKCHMSKSSFLHTFSKAMDTTPIKYITEIKIRNAKRMLLETDMQISEISTVLGFSSPQYFSKTFSLYVGMRPKDYRRKNADFTIYDK